MAKVLPVTEKSIIRNLLEIQAIEFDRGASMMYRELADPGDSAYFLRLMSIELYFKLLYLRKTESIIFGHDIREIFDLIPKRHRQELFSLFDERLRDGITHDAFREWLKYLGNLFVQIRYPFEEFRNSTLEEYEEKIMAFENSAPGDMTHASIVYHMDRIEALVAALRQLLNVEDPLDV